MEKFDLIYNMICDTSDFIIDECEEETEENYGYIRFYYHKTRKTYQMLWDKDTIIEFEEVS